MTGAQRRQTPAARRVTPTVTISVAAALTGAAAGRAPSGVCGSMSKMMGMMVTAISMITVPQTVGVKMRRSRASRAERANWTRAEAATSEASIPGPPSTSAVTQTAMNAPEVPIIRM